MVSRGSRWSDPRRFAGALDKTDGITCFAALLEPFDLTRDRRCPGHLRAHARFLVEEKRAHYLMVIKASRACTDM